MDSRWSYLPDTPHPGVVPLPANFASEAAYFDVGRVRAIQLETDTPAVREVAYFLARELSNRIGRFVKCTTSDANTDHFGAIGLTTATKKLFLTDEGYDLDVKGPLAFISAPNPRGLLHGAITFLQMVESDAEGGLVAHAARAIDKPSLPWRAIRVDATRGRLSTPWLARLVEVAALLRINGLRLALDSTVGSEPWLESLASRCRERGIELLVDRIEPSDSRHPFRIVRLVAPSSADVVATDLPAEELVISDDPIPSVEEIHSCAPEAYALPEDRRCVGVEAWIDWVPDAGETLLERAYLTRLAAFAEVAWTGPFRRSFAGFVERLARFFVVLDGIGVDYDVPPPAGVPDLIEFESECAIELVPPLPGARVEYTLDGTDPAPGSPLADRPLFLNESGELRARTRLRNGKTSAIVRSTIRRLPSA